MKPVDFKSRPGAFQARFSRHGHSARSAVRTVRLEFFLGLLDAIVETQQPEPTGPDCGGLAHIFGRGLRGCGTEDYTNPVDRVSPTQIGPFSHCHWTKANYGQSILPQNRQHRSDKGQSHEPILCPPSYATSSKIIGSVRLRAEFHRACFYGTSRTMTTWTMQLGTRRHIVS
jgi:hypothetical protein